MRLFLLLCFPAASGAGSFHREGGGSAGGAKQVEGAGQPTLTCDANGLATSSAKVATLASRSVRSVTLLLPNGVSEHLERLTDSDGLTSTRFGNSRYVAKLGTDPELIRREACVLRRLTGGDAVPPLVCAADRLIVMENAGRPLTTRNIPLDYRAQVSPYLSPSPYLPPSTASHPH